MRRALLLCLAAACGDDSSSVTPDAAMPVGPVANVDREIVDTDLAFDVTATTGTATITFAASAAPGATLEIGSLTITAVTLGGEPLAYRENAPDEQAKNADGATMDLALPASTEPLSVTVTYAYKATAGGFTGATTKGYTLVWPYYCGNLFPCHSAPSDGTPMTVALTGVPADKTAVYPSMLTEAPAYQFAWAIEAYTELPLGTTTAGTSVSVWHFANETTAATNGTQNLRAVFEWLETTLGPYRFGTKVGSVSVKWGAGAFGGMEHHPMWHVGSAAIGDQETHAHEAAHGWYGDGIRIACWEDFVLSEGTVTYLSARSLDVVDPPVGAAIWQAFTEELPTIPAADKVWPEGCNSIDIIDDDLFTRAPYVRGAFFYRALAERLGATVVDEILRDFYTQYGGKAARMTDMLDLIKTKTSYDATACATTWLRTPTIPTPGACP